MITVQRRAVMRDRVCQVTVPSKDTIKTCGIDAAGWAHRTRALTKHTIIDESVVFFLSRYNDNTRKKYKREYFMKAGKNNRKKQNKK